jgi:hypothetical protein
LQKGLATRGRAVPGETTTTTTSAKEGPATNEEDAMIFKKFIEMNAL